MALNLTSCLCAFLSLLDGLPNRPPRKGRPPSETHADTISSDTLPFLAAGKSGIIYGIDAERVLKVFHDRDAAEIEPKVYQQLGTHPNIAKMLEIQQDGSIVLERGTPLRTICRASAADKIPIQTKIHWLRQAAEGYRYLHGCNIIHCDVGCNNWILTRDDHVKLIDFEGSSAGGGPAGSCYEWFSYCPSVPRVSRRTDIFAFGCAIYEVLTGRPPHYEVEASEDPYKQVEELYTNRQFPDVTDLPLSRLVQSCWHGHVGSMSEVIQELEAFRTTLLMKMVLS